MYKVICEFIFLYNELTLKNEFYKLCYNAYKGETHLGMFVIESEPLNGSDVELLKVLGHYAKPVSSNDADIKLNSFLDLVNKLNEEDGLTLYTWINYRKELGEPTFEVLSLKDTINIDKLNLMEYYEKETGKTLSDNSIQERVNALTEIVLDKFSETDSLNVSNIISESIDGI